jgi:UDP-N-acetylglucosamine:LPS N-acetylglucosamine transferase
MSDVTKRALILSGSLGLGHSIIAEVVADSLAQLGWQSRTLDCMGLLGPRGAHAGDRVFRWLMAAPGAYDALYFSQLRPGSQLARTMDRAALSRLMPRLRSELRARPAQLVVAVFATGASAAPRLAQSVPGLRTVVLCADAAPHRTWVPDGVDLFLVTSEAAAASVRRYRPQARVSVVPPPVRSAFYDHRPRAEARSSLAVPTDARCVLLMGGGWGLGPMEDAARALAEAGVHILAVAGHNRRLTRRLQARQHTDSRLHAFGLVPDIAGLMTAADLVVTLPGAVTCGEARAAGRRLVLLDAMPGHGRENVQRELEAGRADVCGLRTPELVAGVLAALDRHQRAPDDLGPARRWDPAFQAALASIGAG